MNVSNRPARSLIAVGLLLAAISLTAQLFPAATMSWPAADAGTGPKKRSPKPVVSGNLGKQLDQVISKLDLDSGGFYGSVLVAKGEKVLLWKSYGTLDGKPMPPDARWDWASVTKQFTAAAVLRLEMEKKLSLDDPITKYFPSAPKDKAAVTLRHLLNHTSGIEQPKMQKNVHFGNRDAVAKALLEIPLSWEPGSKWQYNNIAYGVIAAVIEKVTKKSYDDYMIKKVFEPARMRTASLIGHSSLEVDRVPLDDRGAGKRFAYGPKMNWGYRGAGGVVASTADLFLWHRALMGNRFLSEDAKKRYYETGLQNYALGWQVTEERGDTFYAHGGDVGKLSTYYLRAKKADVVVAIVYGYRNPSESREETAQRLFRIAQSAK